MSWISFGQNGVAKPSNRNQNLAGSAVMIVLHAATVKLNRTAKEGALCLTISLPALLVLLCALLLV